MLHTPVEIGYAASIEAIFITISWVVTELLGRLLIWLHNSAAWHTAHIGSLTIGCVDVSGVLHVLMQQQNGIGLVFFFFVDNLGAKKGTDT